MRILPASLLLIATGMAAPASAQSAGAFMKNPAFADPPPGKCLTTFDMQHCAAHDLRVADAQMSKRYYQLRASLKPDARQRLLADQRRWLAARDRDCLARGKGGGSIAPVAVASCWVNVTKARYRQLGSWRG